MRLGEDQCAQCGVYLPADKRFLEHRRRLTAQPEPHFCTRRCLQAACSRFLEEPQIIINDFPSLAADPKIGKMPWNYWEKDKRKHISYAAKARWIEEENARAKDEVWDAALEKYAELYRAARTKNDEDTIEKQAQRNSALIDARIAQLDIEIAAYNREQALIAPRPIPDHHRFEHTHILGPSGFGKSTLIQHLFLEDLQKDNPPGYIIIDPKGLMVQRIAQLEPFDPRGGRLYDRLVVVDPTADPPPALNMFKVNHPAGLTPAQQRRITNNLTETFSYIFSSAGSPLTQKMSVPFSFLVRLVFHMQGDVNTLMDLLEENFDQERFAPAIQQLASEDPGARRFFANDFRGKNFSDTRQQIKSRAYEIFKNPDVMQMFAAEDNHLDIARCMRERKIVLVNTALAQLGSSGSQMLGRYVIAMTVNATFARAMIPKHEWHPIYLIIDEFQDFADEEKTPELLRLAREYNVGVTLAHQTMHSKELNEALRTSISTNTSIKYCASPEGVDVNYMARDLRCEPSFLASLGKKEAHAHFACYVRGMNLSHPFKVEVELGNIDKEPKWSAAPAPEPEPEPVAEPPPVYIPPAPEPPKRGFWARLFGGDEPPPQPTPPPPVPDNPPERESAPPPPVVAPAPAPRQAPRRVEDKDEGGWS